MKKKRKKTGKEKRTNKQTKKSDSVTVRYTLCTYARISHRSINKLYLPSNLQCSPQVLISSSHIKNVRQR